MTDLYFHQAYITRSLGLKLGEGLIIMDCDKFKSLNDTLGHQEGDKALIELAATIREAFKGRGICYRIGGDEFSVIVNNDIEELIKRLNSLLASKMEANHNLPTISIGYGIYNGENINAFREEIDKAMYFSKLN